MAAGVDKSLLSLIIVGAAAVFWSIWLCRNDVVFDKKKVNLVCRCFSHVPVGCGPGRPVSTLAIFGNGKEIAEMTVSACNFPRNSQQEICILIFHNAWCNLAYHLNVKQLAL